MSRCPLQRDALSCWAKVDERAEYRCFIRACWRSWTHRDHSSIYLNPEQEYRWKDSLRRQVRLGCDALGIRRRRVHGFGGAAACEFVEIKQALGYTEIEARRELAQWLGHNSHRTEVTYAYVPRKHYP